MIVVPIGIGVTAAAVALTCCCGRKKVKSTFPELERQVALVSTIADPELERKVALVNIIAEKILTRQEWWFFKGPFRVTGSQKTIGATLTALEASSSSPEIYKRMLSDLECKGNFADANVLLSVLKQVTYKIMEEHRVTRDQVAGQAQSLGELFANILKLVDVTEMDRSNLDRVFFPSKEAELEVERAMIARYSMIDEQISSVNILARTILRDEKLWKLGGLFQTSVRASQIDPIEISLKKVVTSPRGFESALSALQETCDFREEHVPAMLFKRFVYKIMTEGKISRDDIARKAPDFRELLTNVCKYSSVTGITLENLDMIFFPSFKELDARCLTLSRSSGALHRQSSSLH